jgi:hypothetical protein
MTANHKSAEAAPAVPATKPVVVLSQSQAVTVDELKHVRRHVKTLEGREKELSVEVKGWIRGSGGGVNADGELVASVADRAGRRVIDYARLAKDFPDAYAACVSIGNAAEVLTLH